MKKALWIIVALCLLLAVFAGCTPKSESKDYDVVALSQKISSEGKFSDLLNPVDEKMAASLYGFSQENVTDCALLCSTGATTEEIGIFKCADTEYAKELFTIAQARVKSQRSAYESYAPAEMPKLDDAVVLNDGLYVFYVVSLDSSKAEEIING